MEKTISIDSNTQSQVSLAGIYAAVSVITEGILPNGSLHAESLPVLKEVGN